MYYLFFKCVKSILLQKVCGNWLIGFVDNLKYFGFLFCQIKGNIIKDYFNSREQMPFPMLFCIVEVAIKHNSGIVSGNPIKDQMAL